MSMLQKPQVPSLPKTVLRNQSHHSLFSLLDEVLDGLLVLLSRCLAWPVSVFLAVRLTRRVLLAVVEHITDFKKPLAVNFGRFS